MFRSCAVDIWAVTRGSPLSQNEGPLAFSVVNFAALVGSCMWQSGATLQRHGDSLYTVKTLSVFRVYEDDLVFVVHCARGLRMCGPRGSLALCQMHFFWHIHVDHRVVWHVMLTQRCSMCALFSLRLLGFGAVHCDTLATRLWQLARRQVSSCHFLVGVFLSSLHVNHAVYFSAATISAQTVDIISNGTTKRINMFQAFVLWRVEVNCRWCCGKELLFASVIAIWFVFSYGFSEWSVSFALLLAIFSRVSIVSGPAHRRRKVQRNSVASNFANYSFEWAVAVVVMFSCVRNSGYVVPLVCAISWPHKRVDFRRVHHGF